jgi:predicted CXXCH cytochrome family protein
MLARSGDAACFQCHDRKLTEGKVKHAALDNGCTACHDAHASDAPGLISAKSVSEMCQTCHGDLAKHYHPTASAKPDPRTGLPMDCVSCHKPHASEHEGLLAAEPKRELCIQCHDPSMAPEGKK